MLQLYNTTLIGYVRGNTPIPEPTAFEWTFRSGKHPNSRTVRRKRDTPFGKPPQNPNELPQKRYSVRENTPKPERTAAKKILRSGNHPKTRTNCRKKDTPFGKTYHIPNGVLFLVWGGPCGAPPFRAGPYGGTTFQGWALRGLPLKLLAYWEEAEHSACVDEQDV